MPSDDDDDDDGAAKGGGGAGATLKRRASRSLSSVDPHAYGGGSDASLHPGALPTRPAADAVDGEPSPSMRLLMERAARASAPYAPSAKPRTLTEREREAQIIDARLRDPTRMMTVILNASQVRDGVANGTLDPSKVRPIAGSADKFVTDEPQAFIAVRARETAERIKAESRKHPTTRGGAAANELERMELAYLDYTQTVDADRADPWTFAQQYTGFRNGLRWNSGRQSLTTNADASYRGRNAFLLQHKDAVPPEELARIREEERRLRPRKTKASLVDSLGLSGVHVERQRASLQRTPQSSAGARAASPPPPSLVFRSAAEEEEEEAEFNEETAGASAPRFFVYELPLAETPDALRAPPSRAEVERALADYKRVGPMQTWAEIVGAFARREDRRSGRIRADVLPSALRHGGVVLLRRLRSEDGRLATGYLSVYLEPWVDEAGAREHYVEAAVARWLRVRQQATQRGDLYFGDHSGGFSNQTEAEMRASANRDYDRQLAHRAMLEAHASERALQAQEHRVRRDAEAQIRDYYLTHGDLRPRDEEGAIITERRRVRPHLNEDLHGAAPRD
jgi:hypothetical protein